MFKKVVFGSTCKTEDGKILGKEVGGFEGRSFFEDEDGNMYSATYGILDESGNFHAFCTNTRSCGGTCFNATSPSCRYNRKYQASAGYYVDID